MTPAESSEWREVLLRYRPGFAKAFPSLDHFAQDNPPACYWLDPRPILPDPPDYPPVFGAGFPVLPARGAVEEAGLYWSCHGVYVVAREHGGYRWLEFTEITNPAGAGWSKPLTVQAVESPVLLRENAGFPAMIYRVEYRYGSHVVAWRLAIPNGDDIATGD